MGKGLLMGWEKCQMSWFWVHCCLAWIFSLVCMYSLVHCIQVWMYFLGWLVVLLWLCGKSGFGHVEGASCMPNRFHLGWTACWVGTELWWNCRLHCEKSRFGACESIRVQVSWWGCTLGLGQGGGLQGIGSIALIIIHSTGVSTYQLLTLMDGV